MNKNTRRKVRAARALWARTTGFPPAIGPAALLGWARAIALVPNPSAGDALSLAFIAGGVSPPAAAVLHAEDALRQISAFVADGLFPLDHWWVQQQKGLARAQQVCARLPR